MESERLENPSAFRHSQIRTEGRLLIQSTCGRCGKSKIVSHHDGSLEQWEDGHRCEPDKGRSRTEVV